MSEIAQQTTGLRSAATAVVHESYSFACMRCGHGWEQSYEIEHHIDGDGHEFVMYVVDGRIVPSPLSRPTCQNCEGHVVRIMRAGQVSSVQNCLPRPRQGQSAAGSQPHQHWHLSDLLHVFHRKAS
jgi:Zn finger protein HypA/HybF involved in hydrogenase expression